MMTLETSTEAELLRDFRQHRHEAAFDELVRRHLPMVLQLARRRVGDDQAAQEIVQNVFIKLARKAPRLDPDSIIAAWLHRVTVQETIDHHRREYRRQRAMKRYHDEQRTSHRLPAMTSDLLGNLDEALAHLSSADRSLIMLRFQDAMSFREIAQRLGKSEDAARKRLSRTLDKLAKRLRPHGSPLPLTTLTGSLAIILENQAAAAPAMVTAVSRAALTAPSIKAGSLLGPSILFVMKTKLLLIASSLGLAAFVSGRHVATEFQSQLIHQAYQSSLQRTQFAEQLALHKTSDDPPAPRSLADIMSEAAEIAEDRGVASHYKLRLLLAELPPGIHEEAIAHLEAANLSQRAYDRLGGLLAGLWAYENGEEAITWVHDNLDPAQTNALGLVLKAWSESHPAKAYAHYQALAAANDGTKPLLSFRWLAKSIFAGWAQSDPAGAVAALQNITIEDEDGALLGIAQATAQTPDPDPILNAISQMPPSGLRARLLRRTASAWAAEEPHAAAAWIHTIPNLTPEERLMAKGEVAEEWLRYDSSDITAIAAWFLSGAPASRRDQLTHLINQEISRRQTLQP